MIDTTLMADRYRRARELFLSNADKAGWEAHSLPHPLKGPEGIDLYTDVIHAGNPDSENLLMISSGTHGIEGHLGSEIQSRLLAENVIAPDRSDRHAVMVHAVNPYGFAWHRRVNEDNIDLNRNFIDFDAPLPENEGYEAFRALLNPAEWDEGYEEKLKAEAALAIERMGLGALFKAVSGGQYEHPSCIQYGGQEPCWSRRMMEDVWAQVMANKRRATQIDLHTGLGSPGEGVLMTYGKEEQTRIKRARAMWQDIFVSPPAQTVDVLTTGVLGPYLEKMFADRDILAVVLEYGTKEPVDVLHAIAADNWLHHHGKVDSERGALIKQLMLDAFYLSDTALREKTYQRARDVVVAAENAG